MASGFKQNQKTKGGTSSTVLAAVALQDHLVKNLNLGGLGRTGPRQIGLGPAAKAKQKKTVRSVVDTGRNRNSKPKKEEHKEEEYNLDPKPPPLTLAQKLGLIEAPDQLLSETDWQKAKEKSNKRDDSGMPCVICKEDFGLKEQVLLSCTHVFHRSCLQAFERFTGKKTCPMCRKEQYQTRVIHEGSKQHRIKCASRIQAAWRGYVVRCWYLKFREEVPPNDPNLKKKFYQEKLSSITDRIIRSCDFNLNQFLSEIDQSLEASRNVFRSFETSLHRITDDEWDQIQLKAVERGKMECPICLTGLALPSDINIPDNAKVKSVFHLTSADSINKTKRTSTQKTSEKGRQSVQGGGDNEATNKEGRQTVLLSCSHVYHSTCLGMFEELTIVEKNRHKCPVCRTAYQKKIISVEV
ncbi:RING finger protein 32 [Mytilus coruscus]|uniref:RING finger protein 32 n=1 Tax=Mytilus coruscus TaxID=42192 RepID=A0A6J8DDN8_MYTCO|nr:RING finger protein 32 [Mytilus coruscus]